MADPSLAVCLAAIKKRPGQFYVYVLYRPDGRPFYVGCGKVKLRGKTVQRIAFHEREARLGVFSHKCNVIRLIWGSGANVAYEIDSWHPTEVHAFAREKKLIAIIGRADLGRGPLTNWSDGGDGLVNRTEEARIKASRSMTALVDDEWRRRSSVRIKAHWASPEGRALRLAVNNHPDVKRRKSEASQRVNAGPTKAKKSATMSRRWKDPEYQARQREAHLAAMANVEVRKKQGAASKRRWSDPEFRKRMMEARRIARIVRSQLTLNLIGD